VIRVYGQRTTGGDDHTKSRRFRSVSVGDRLLRILRDHYARQSELYACDLTHHHVFVIPVRVRRTGPTGAVESLLDVLRNEPDRPVRAAGRTDGIWPSLAASYCQVREACSMRATSLGLRRSVTSLNVPVVTLCSREPLRAARSAQCLPR